MSAADLAWLMQQAYGGAAASAASTATAASPAFMSMATPTDASWAAQFAGLQQSPGAAADAWTQSLMMAAGAGAMANRGVIVPAAAAQGKGKGGGGGTQRVEADSIYIAVNTAMLSVAPDDITTASDGAWDAETLKRRLAKYFRSAAKGMSFTGDYTKVIDTFCDNALGNVTWALQGTKWAAKADFTLVVEVCVTELFPEDFQDRIPDKSLLQDAILKSHDRAMEEARFQPFLQDTVKSIVEGKKAQNKLYNAAEEARRDIVQKLLANKDDTSDFFYASENGIMGKIQDFAREWITDTLKKLGEWPESVIDREDAIKLFNQLFSSEENCLPRSLVQYMVEPLPQPWDFIAETLNAIYKVSADKHAAEMAAASLKRKARKEEGPNFLYKTSWCRNMLDTGTCKMGDWCVFAHAEDELYMHQAGVKGMMMAAKGDDFGKGKGFNGFGKAGKGSYGKDYGKGYGYDDGYGKNGKGDWGKGPYGAPAKGKGKGPRPSAAPQYEEDEEAWA